MRDTKGIVCYLNEGNNILQGIVCEGFVLQDLFLFADQGKTAKIRLRKSFKLRSNNIVKHNDCKLIHLLHIASSRALTQYDYRLLLCFQ